MRTPIICLSLLLALIGCSSKYDDCLATETANAQEALVASNPVFKAYAGMEAVESRLEAYYRVLHTQRVKLDSDLGPEDRKCDMAPDSDCTGVQQALYSALATHIEEAGFADVDDAITALWDMQEKHTSSDELDKVMAAGDAAAGGQPHDEDIDGWVQHELTAYKTERDYHLQQIVLPKLTAAASEKAAAVCKSRGL